MRLNHPDRGRVLSQAFGVVRPYRTFSIYRGNKVCRVLKHAFEVGQAHRTITNRLQPQLDRASKVCRVL